MPTTEQGQSKPARPIPPEIWLKIASFLPSNIVQSLYSVNRALFVLSMQARWETVVVSIAEENTSLKSYEKLLRLS
jgi:hypothetical protein